MKIEITNNKIGIRTKIFNKGNIRISIAIPNKQKIKPNIFFVISFMIDVSFYIGCQHINSPNSNKFKHLKNIFNKDFGSINCQAYLVRFKEQKINKIRKAILFAPVFISSPFSFNSVNSLIVLLLVAFKIKFYTFY